jgi:prevent-host-death family protein
MKTAAISKLKTHLSDFLNQVKAGSEVLITDRGKPVGRLVPISRTQTPRDALARMEKQALIKLGSGKLPKDFWKMPRPKIPRDLYSGPSWKNERLGGRPNSANSEINGAHQ